MTASHSLLHMVQAHMHSDSAPSYTVNFQLIQNFEYPFYIRKNESGRGHMELRSSSDGNDR